MRGGHQILPAFVKRTHEYVNGCEAGVSILSDPTLAVICNNFYTR